MSVGSRGSYRVSLSETRSQTQEPNGSDQVILETSVTQQGIIGS